MQVHTDESLTKINKGAPGKSLGCKRDQEGASACKDGEKPLPAVLLLAVKDAAHGRQHDHYLDVEVDSALAGMSSAKLNY